MLSAMGVFGFIAQTLLTMGLQRETAGRGTLAVYIQLTKSGAASPTTATSVRGVGVGQALAIEEGRGLLAHADTDGENVDSPDGRRTDRPIQAVGAGVGQDSKNSN
ncbi:hypothetical protein FIBSPDRAFT_427198 [Athelia psychrophila]|uniref:Uncharacterized protein n=1 Tax=Athelia psychrophila TaxID=1759441 RepID=A0A166MS93_9AGAM|nr:hypothetical protein FIBSPDRAFT_427198 [Fibularhizoctonia sp. CBS 109695]